MLAERSFAVRLSSVTQVVANSVWPSSGWYRVVSRTRVVVGL